MVRLRKMKTKPSIIILSSITLFILVLLGVYITNLIAHQEKFAYAEYHTD